MQTKQMTLPLDLHRCKPPTVPVRKRRARRYYGKAPIQLKLVIVIKLEASFWTCSKTGHSRTIQSQWGSKQRELNRRQTVNNSYMRILKAKAVRLIHTLSRKLKQTLSFA